MLVAVIKCSLLRGVLNPLPFSRAGIKHVHYMSVDTEGSELSILKTIDFGKIYIEFLQVWPFEDSRVR